MANSQISCIDSGVSQPLKCTAQHHWFIAMRSLGKFGCSGGWFGVCSYDKCPGDTFGNIFGSQCTAALTQMISHRMAAFPPSSEWMTNNFCYSGSHSGKPYCNSFPCTNRTQANDGDMVMSPGPCVNSVSFLPPACSTFLLLFFKEISWHASLQHPWPKMLEPMLRLCLC